MPELITVEATPILLAVFAHEALSAYGGFMSTSIFFPSAIARRSLSGTLFMSE